MTAAERVLARIEHHPSGCWLFTGARNAGGYGVVCEGGKRGLMRLVHRVVYEALVGPIPEGHVIDHVWPRCQYRYCVNPAHLEAVTPGENQRRAWATGRMNRDTSAAVAARVAKDRAKTHCPKGHPYDEENTYVDKRGKRNCRECGRAAARAWKAKRAVAA